MTSSKLGILPGFRWLVDWHSAVFLPAILMLAVPEILAVVLEGRVANPLDQYKGVFPGDAFLSIALGLAVMLAMYNLPRSFYHPWYAKWWWHAVGLVFGVGFASLLWYFDVNNTIHQYYPEAAYTWAQLLGPTHLYHSFIVVLMGYVGCVVVIPVLIHAVPGKDAQLVPFGGTAERVWPYKAAIILLIAAWMVCFLYLDNTLPRPDLHDVHGTWFGGLYAR